MFRVGLQSYFRIATIGMKQSLLQHKEVKLFCEEGMTIAEVRNGQSIPQKTK
jgi:hypothetical protein